MHRNKLVLHGRYEFIQKSAEELTLDETFGEAVFPVHAGTIGFNYDLLNIEKLVLAGGSQFTLYKTDSRLISLYGKNPMAIEVFIRLLPSLLRM